MEFPKVKYELEVAYGSRYGIEEAAALMEVLRANAPSCGKKVKQFEEAFASYCGVKHALAVTSATTGLTLAGIAAGVGPGTEVITTPITWVATAFPFSSLGASMVFCDVDPRTLTMDPDRLEALITPRTRAIVPVHLAGQCCAMDRIMEVARRHGVRVIEDCAHNPGGSYLGRKSGALADLGVFSFHQQKNMGTLGEGGMVTTDDRGLFERVLSYRSLCCRIYGGSDKYLPIDEERSPMGKEYWRLLFDDVGYNFRMTDAQAAVGIEQLKKLDGHNALRRDIARRISEGLKDIPGLQLPWIDPKGVHVFHFFVVQLGNEFPLRKTDFMWELYTAKGIKAWSHYMPVHLTDPYLRQGHREGECPVAEEAFHRFVSLPVHPRLTDEAVAYMTGCVAELGRAPPGGGAMTVDASRRDAILARFRSLYAAPPTAWVRAPGRAELLGTDTDDHLGYVMTMGIHLDAWIAFRPSGTRRARIHSMNVEKTIEWSIGEEPVEPAGSWDRYVNGVSRALRSRGHEPAGVDAVVHGTVPIGGGLSSSAALEVATALMFQSAGGFSLPPKETAEICQQAENQSAGVLCGILDQYSSVFAREGTALLLDCRSLSHVEVRIPSDIAVVICDTNYPRTLAGSDYARRRQECDEGTRLLRERDPQIRTLRDVNSPLFERLQGCLPEVLRKRCRFIVEENQRVVAFMAAVVRNDRPAMRELCAQSFQGERDLYEKTVPAMERMYEAMTDGPGVVAARQSGGGFGGCMIAYVRKELVREFTASVHAAYLEKTGLVPAIHVTSPTEGAGPIAV